MPRFGTTRATGWPEPVETGLGPTLATFLEGDTLAVSKLDRLARFVPDARYIAKDLEPKCVSLASMFGVFRDYQRSHTALVK